MPAYTNNLRLREITTGDESGTWGDTTNSNLELIADAFGSGTEGLSGTTHTTTIADSTTASEGRAIYMKYTGALGANNTITLAPNTINKLWIIENATTDSGSSGPYSIIISQGSGDNVTIPNGKVAVVYADGAGGAADVKEAFANLKIGPSLTVGNAAAEDTKVVFDGNAQDYYVGLDDTDDDLKIGLGSTVGTTSAITIDENQDTTITQDLAVSGVGPHSFGAARVNNVRFNVAGAFTSGGVADYATGFNASAAITGAIGDTVALAGAIFQNTITTQGTNTNISRVAQVMINEPQISNNLASSGKPDVAATLWVQSAPTEGDINAAIYVAAGDVTMAATAKLYLDGGGNTYITEASSDVVNLYTGGTSRMQWQSDGVIIPATNRYYLDGGGNTYITESSADVTSFYSGGIRTITAASNGVYINEDNNIAMDFVVEGQLNANMINVDATNRGRIGIGSAPDANSWCYVAGEIIADYWSGGNNQGFYVDTHVHVSPGDEAYVFRAKGDITLAGSGTTNLFATAYFQQPTVTDGGGSTVTNTATVYIKDASSEGTNDYALWVDDGGSRFDGQIHVLNGAAGSTADSSMDELVLENGGDCGMSILSNTGSSIVAFGDTEDSSVGQINYIHSSNVFRFTAGGVSHFWMASDGFYVGAFTGNNQFRDDSAGSGSTTMYIGNQSITTSSDRRLKTNIVDSSLDAVHALNQLRVTEFNWDDPSDQSHNNRNARGTWTGMIAQEVVEHLPFTVNAPRDEDKVIDYEDDSTWSIEPMAMCGVLVKAVQELSTRIEALEAQLDG